MHKKVTPLLAYLFLLMLLAVNICSANETEAHIPPFKNVPRTEQPVFGGFSKSFIPETSTFDHLIGDLNGDGLIDNVLLPHLISNIELDGSKFITSYLGTPGGSIALDPVLTELSNPLPPPLIRTQGALGDFKTEAGKSDLDLAIAGLKAEFYVAICEESNYVFTLSEIGNFHIFHYVEGPTSASLEFVSGLSLGGFTESGSLDVDLAHNVAVAATTSGLHFIDIANLSNPIKASTIPALKLSFVQAQLGFYDSFNVAFALDTLIIAIGASETLMRTFDISDIYNPVEFPRRIEYSLAPSSLSFNVESKYLAAGFYITDTYPVPDTISLVDVSNPSDPKHNEFEIHDGWIMDVFNTADINNQPNMLYFVALGSTSNYISIYDIHDPANPVYVDGKALEIMPWSIYVDSEHMWAYISSISNQVVLKFDLDEMTDLCLYPLKGQAYETDVKSIGTRAFIAGNGAGIHAIDVMQPTSCQYRADYQEINKFAVYKGDGTGHFEILSGYPIDLDSSSIPSDIATAYINQADSNPDLAITDWGLKVIYIGLGDSNGGFSWIYPPISVADFHPLKIIADDFNSDGKTDIVFISSDKLPMDNGLSRDKSVAVIGTPWTDLHFLPGNGDGTFGPIIHSTCVKNPEDFAIADINNDGLLDIAVLDIESGKVQFLINEDGNKGHFIIQSEITLLDPNAVALADFSGDAIVDAAISTRTSEDLLEVDIVIVSNLMSTPVEISRSPFSHASAMSEGLFDIEYLSVLDLHSRDINNDNIADLLISNNVPATVSVIHNLGNARFNNLPFWIEGKAAGSSIASGDVDGDGLIDLITFNFNKQFEFYKNTGVEFESVVTSTLPITAVVDIELLHFDQDTMADIMLIGLNGTLPILLFGKSDGDGTFTQQWQFVLPYGAVDMLKGDFNSDGDEDLVVVMDTSFNNGLIWVVENKGDGLPYITSAAIPSLSTYAQITKGNFNNDEYIDLATACWNWSSPYDYYICLFSGSAQGTFTFSNSFLASVTPGGIAAGNFDQDNLSDIAYSNANLNEIKIRFNDNGTFPPALEKTLFAFNPQKLNSVDVNFDDFDDLLTIGNRVPYFLGDYERVSSQSVGLFLSRGDQSNPFRPLSDYKTAQRPYDFDVNDLNNDGRPDVAIANLSHYIWDGAPSSDPQAVTVLLNSYPFPVVKASIPDIICTPADHEILTITGENFQNSSVFINSFTVEVTNITPSSIQGTITIPDEISLPDADITVRNNIFGYFFEDVLSNGIQITIKSTIASASPVSIQRSGGDLITVTGTGFIDGTTIVTVEAQLSDGQPWVQPVFANIDPSGKMLTFFAPEAPEALIASICVQNNDCRKSCLYESLGYYDESKNQHPFTPQIGITSGFTPVTFYVPQSVFCSAKFDKSYGITKSNQNGQLVVLTPTHPYDYVIVSLCNCFAPDICTPLTAEYEYATFSYVTGSTANLEVINTDENNLVDFNPFVIGDQSQLALKEAARSSAFSPASAMELPYQIAGRYAFVIMGEKIAKIDTGSNEIIAESRPFRPPYPLTRVYYKDVDITLPDGSNIIVVASDYLFDWPQSQGGLATFSADEVDGELKLIDYYFVPDFPDTSTVNLKMVGNKAYISALKSSDGPPYYQMVFEAQITNEGYISNVVVYTTNHILTDLQGIYTIGEGWFEQSCYDDQFYKALYYVVPDENDIDLLNLSTCQCLKPNVGQRLSSPQDLTVAYIYDDDIGDFDWKGFVINTGSDSWLRINDLCESASNFELLKTIPGKTPVDSEIRSNNDKMFVVNMFSEGENQDDITIIDPATNEASPFGIRAIPDGFFPRNIAIQEVIEAINYIDAAKATIEMMEGDDFTTPSKRQVLLNKLDVIEHLFDTPANEQAIISNTEAFQNQVENFVVNETREKELLIYAEGIIASVDQ